MAIDLKHEPDMDKLIDRTRSFTRKHVLPDLPLASPSREVRPFRVYDGPSEVDRWALTERTIGAAERAARKSHS